MGRKEILENVGHLTPTHVDALGLADGEAFVRPMSARAFKRFLAASKTIEPGSVAQIEQMEEVVVETLVDAAGAALFDTDSVQDVTMPELIRLMDVVGQANGPDARAEQAAKN